jgi:predicted naringenin-chalcone synthase
MSWRIGDTGFIMRLDSDVPRLLHDVAGRFVEDMCKQAGLQFENVSHWAIHPGGRKILEAVENALQLPRRQLTNSYRVLRDFGNMSSATILFVLQRELAQVAAPAILCALAFGPGLTIEGALLQTE